MLHLLNGLHHTRLVCPLPHFCYPPPQDGSERKLTKKELAKKVRSGIKSA